MPAWHRWLKRTFVTGFRTRSICRADRLRVQALEDRITPAVYNVTTTADVIDPSDGLLSLREAVLAANASVGVADTINLPAGTYVLTLTGANEDAGLTGDLDITDTLTIQGAGAADTIVDGNQADRIIDLRMASLTLDGLTLQNGRVTGFGGAISSVLQPLSAAGILTLTDCVVRDNQARGADAATAGQAGADGQGGGIYQTGGVLNLTGCTLSDNLAAGGSSTVASEARGNVGGTARGGAAFFQSAEIGSISDCTVSGNQAVGGDASNSAGNAYAGSAGGGGLSGGSSTQTVSGCTITGNRAIGGNASSPVGSAAGGLGDGGGVTFGGTTLTACLVSDNTAEGGAAMGQTIAQGGLGRGGGVQNSGGGLVACTLTGNQAVGGPGNGGTAGYGGEGLGGGLESFTATVTNCTISGNTATGGDATTAAGSAGGVSGDGRGGGIAMDQGLLTNSTLTLNRAEAGAGNRGLGMSDGGGFSSNDDNNNPGASIRSTIIAANSAPGGGPDVARTDSAPPVSLGNNLIGDGSGIPRFTDGVNGDQVGSMANPLDPRLGPLADNGGPTPTHAPLTGSPAIDRGSNAAGLATDQRGAGFPRTVGTGTDVGAVESPFTPPTAAIVLPDDVTATGGTAYTIVVTYTDDEAIDVSTLDNGDILVTGPNGFSEFATFVGVDVSSNGTPRTAIYRLTPPGGTWDVADYGTYTVSIQPFQVADTAGGTVMPGTPVTFRVLTPATFLVTNANDTGPGSLRDAITQANARAGTADTITFEPNFFLNGRTITLAAGPLTITDPLTIDSPGPDEVIVNGNGAGRVITIDAPTPLTVTLKGLTLTGGQTTGAGDANSGGAVYFHGASLTVQDCVITGNTTAADGGAIFADSAVTVLDSQLTGNSATSAGGALFVDGASAVVQDSIIGGNTADLGGGMAVTGSGGVTVLGSTFSNNVAARGPGGGIDYDAPPAGLTIANSTFFGNSATGFLNGRGGAVALTAGTAWVMIENDTVVGNSAAVGGGGLYAAAGSDPLGVVSTIVTGNTGPGGPDILFAGTVVLDHSAVGSATGFTLGSASASNLPFGTSIPLTPLGDYGGPTQLD